MNTAVKLGATHAELVVAAERWLRTTKRLRVVLVDIRSAMTSELPDAIGWSLSGFATLVECKASRADFFRDAKKTFRIDPARGMGAFRYYLVPSGLVQPQEVPAGWGLLDLTPRGVTQRARSEQFFPADYVERSEKTLLLSALARATEGWGRRMFGGAAPPLTDGDPHPTASKIIRELRREVAQLRTALHANEGRETT